jgi:cytochrome oxidase Cu insertion factor (SCO1/SenC/PrrC family)
MRWLIAGGVALLLGVGAVTAVIVRLSDVGDDTASPVFETPDDGPYRGSEPPEGIRLEPFVLTSYRGGRVSSASLAGSVVALMFLESKCKKACPIIAVQVARGIDRLTAAERRRVRVVAISTHPGDDTPENVRRFVAKSRAAGRIDYLLGSEAELRPVWRRYYILSALDSGDADTHSASVHIYDRNGDWVSSLHPGVDLTPENFAHDMRRALNPG